jgi:PEP-CTERM motif-containing protein
MRMRLASIVLLVLSLMVAAPAFAATLYSNGAINGTIDAWNTCCGFQVTDSFTISSSSTVTGFDGGFWVAPGDTPVHVDWSIGTAAFGSGSGSGTAALSNSLFCAGCGFGFYDIYTSTAAGLSVSLGPGTYWLTLQNGTTAGAGNMFWDENDGPSMAQQSGTGVIGSEAFNIYGHTNMTTVPEPGTLLMLASGILGLGGIVRRKLNL